MIFRRIWKNAEKLFLKSHIEMLNVRNHRANKKKVKLKGKLK